MSEKSEWLGLWNTREGVYRSKAITKKQIQELPVKSRIVLRYNKYYEKGGDRPRFVLSFMDTQAQDEFCFEMQNFTGYAELLNIIKNCLDEIRKMAIWNYDDNNLRAYLTIEDKCDGLLECIAEYEKGEV